MSYALASVILGLVALPGSAQEQTERGHHPARLSPCSQQPGSGCHQV